jgi:hypothetical protein
MAVRKGTDLFFDLIDPKHIKDVFCCHAEPRTEKGRILPSRFYHALQDLGIIVHPEKAVHLFEEGDMDEDGGLDLAEFSRVVGLPSELEQWSATLPLAKLLGCCLEALLANDLPGGKDTVPSGQLRRLCHLSRHELDGIAVEFSRGLRRLLADRTSILRQCYEELDRRAADCADGSSAKFQSFPMAAGDARDFHSGLTGRVGAARHCRFLHLTCSWLCPALTGDM